MDLTSSYADVFPPGVLARYEFLETRNAAAILAATNPEALAQLVQVLRGFALRTSDLLNPGGNESALAARLNGAFRSQGWREGRVDTSIKLQLWLMPYHPDGESDPTLLETETANQGYKVDNVRDRVALDVEWNAKDGNLDRDIAAYRALYDAALIDVGVMVTRTQNDLRELGAALGAPNKILGTTTTTNVEKLRPRVTRGDTGGCPFLAVLICAKTWTGEVDTPE